MKPIVVLESFDQPPGEPVAGAHNGRDSLR
jgi:hypothetical protein